MKVIVAGLPKTGTKSMNDAFTILGYTVYDALENLVLLQDEYIKILYKGWTTEDFRRMYKDVDVVIDIPACFFWEEIHKAFPDAQIILTMRDNEDQWWQSVVTQLETQHRWRNRIFEYFSPSAWRARTLIMSYLSVVMFGIRYSHPFAPQPTPNEQLTKKGYRLHNAYVMQTAPKDKLLVFKCSDGWEPLCKFLGVSVPTVPFPWKNVGGSVYKEMAAKHPIFRGMLKEARLSIAKHAITTGVVAICAYKYGVLNSIQAIYDHVKVVLAKLWLW